MDRFESKGFYEDLDALRQIQRTIASQVVESPLAAPPDLVAALDVHLSGDTGVAVAVVMKMPDLELVESVVATGTIDFPYIPGFLSFREAPLCLNAVNRLSRAPDLVLIDGHGKAHPLRCGVACHIGVELDMPTIGVAKSRLVGRHEDPGMEKGSRTDLVHRRELVGKVVRTRDNVRPVFVSVGNRIELDEAVGWVLELARRYRLPEPSHEAHKLASAEARRHRETG